ncbi:MAG: hypothetical protein ABIG44_09765 [Planctomycetota bacterium]
MTMNPVKRLSNITTPEPRASARAPHTLFIGCMSLLLTIGAATARAESVHYTLTPLIDTGCLHVEVSWDTHTRRQSALIVSPRWGTVDDVPALIKELRIEGVTNVKAQGTRWLLDHPPGATIKCTYKVDPGRRQLSWTTTQHPVTTRNFFHGMGAAFLLVPQAGGGLPEEYETTLRWRLPEGWKAVCSWGQGSHIGALLSPADMRHSVYLAGRITTRTKTIAGLTVTVAVRERFAFDADEFAQMAATIVAHECAFMEEIDFPPYLVTAVPVGEPVKTGDAHLSGMGLYQSFALFSAPNSKLTDAFEHLFAHELFHYWNGRVLKAEKPDKLAYWFVEGFTDYYALRILHERGFWSHDTYAKWINRHLREYHANPAIHASNQDIAALYWKERDTVGEVPYQRGLLLGLRWHRLARDHGVPDGIDRLFKTLVERGRASGYEISNEKIRRAGIELLGDWFGPEFDQFVTDAETVDVPLDALAPDLSGTVGPIYEFELGFDRKRSLSNRRIMGLIPDSSAAKAGVHQGDELLGWIIPSDASQKVELQIQRDNRRQTIRYYPRGQRSYVLQFEAPKPRRDSRP